MSLTSNKPKSWFLFLAGVALGLFVFLPLAIIGLTTERIPLFLTGMTGAGIFFIVAAFVGMWLATNIAQGRYRDLRTLDIRDQVWVAVAAVVALPLLAMPQDASAQSYPLARDELRRCMDGDADLGHRGAQLDAERRMNDREGASIARAAAQLAEDLRRVDPADVTAVAAHNARSAEHNRRVEAHNLRVNDMNAEAREHNRDQSDHALACGTRSFYPRDRDVILEERRVYR